jgi:hypothetical protein
MASRYSNISSIATGRLMKYLLLLVLLGLAGVEYFHHVADGHGAGTVICADPRTQSQEARELLRDHLRSHR